jgi:sugar lactone lactonase YvrE
MDLSTRRIFRVAGTGKAGYKDGPLAEASFNGPKGLVAREDRELYVADTENQVIRYIDLVTGTVTTVAGSGPSSRGYGGDGGPPTRANLDRPHGIAVDARGTIYVGDTESHRVRRVEKGR